MRLRGSNGGVGAAKDGAGLSRWRARATFECGVRGWRGSDGTWRERLLCKVWQKLRRSAQHAWPGDTGFAGSKTQYGARKRFTPPLLRGELVRRACHVQHVK